MKVQINRKTITIAIVALLVILIIIGIFAPKKQIIAFYDLSETEILGIQTAVLAMDKKTVNPKSYKFVTYESSLPLETQLKLKKPAVLIGRSNSAFREAVLTKKSKVIDSKNLEKMTSSIKGSALSFDDKIVAQPVLSDNFEIAVNLDLYRKLKIKTLATWDDLENFAVQSKEKYGSAIMLNTKDADSFLNFIGAMIEAFDGRAAYATTVKKLNEYVGDPNFNGVSIIRNFLEEENSPLQKTLEVLRRWNEKGLFVAGTFNADNADLKAAMANGKVAITFMTLKEHREIPRETIEHFSSIYVPSSISPSARRFTAPIVYAAAFKKGKKIDALLNQLSQKETQEKLTALTGLAPVLAECKPGDRQSDDARYWVAATNPPLVGLGKDTNLSMQEKDDFSKSIQATIRY